MEGPAADKAKPSLLRRIEIQALAAPDQIAIDCPYAGALSYAHLLEHVENARQQLNEFRLGGRCVAYELPISAAQVVLALASLSSGQCLPLNPAWTEPEKQRCLARHGAKALFVCADDSASRAATSFSIDRYSLQLHAGECLATGVDEDREGLILHTSGSSGQPRALLLRNQQLLFGADNVLQSLSLSHEDVVLHCLPPFHVGAFVDVLLAPLFAGGGICLSQNANPDVVLARLRQVSCTWYQAVPTMSHALLERAIETGGLDGLRGLRFLRSVSSALPEAWAERWLQQTSVPILEIYGMSETAGVIASPDVPQLTFRPGFVGKPVNQELMIVDRSGNPCAAGHAGEIWVRGRNVFDAYIGESSGTGESCSLQNGWFATGDEGCIDEDGRLSLLGRKKELINRGGEKISPLEIDAALLACHGVEDAAGFAIPHQSLGETVAAAVVPARGKQLETEQLKQELSATLAAYKMPQHILVLDQLPRTLGGKLQRHRLPDLVGSVRSEPARNSLQAGKLVDDPLMQTLLSQWQKVLDRKDIHPEDDFFDIGGDSLIAANLMTNLAEQFDEPLPLTSLFEYPTLKALHAYLQRALLQDNRGSQDDSDTRASDELAERIRALLSAWPGKPAFPTSLLMANHTLGLNPPLFWGCQDGRELAALCQAFGPEQPVYGFRSLLDVAERSQQANQSLALRYVEDLVRLVPEGPVLIGGFCEAAKIAFEMARIIEERGRTPALLVLMEQFVPRHYGGRTALIFCEDSKYSPWRHSRWPEQGWRKFYSGPLISLRCPNRHRQFFTDEWVDSTAAMIREQLELAVHRLPYQEYENGVGEVPVLQSAPADFELATKLSADFLRIDLAESPQASCVIRNGSDEAIEFAGKGLSAHLRLRRCYDGRIKNWRLGSVLLDQRLAAGETQALTIDIESVPSTGLWQAELSLFQEGLPYVEAKAIAITRFWQWPATIRHILHWVKQRSATIMKKDIRS